MSNNSAKKTSNRKVKEAVGIFVVLIVVLGILFGILTMTQCGKDEKTHTAKVDDSDDVTSVYIPVENEEEEIEFIPVGAPTSFTDEETDIHYVVCKRGICAEAVYKDDGPYIIHYTTTEGSSESEESMDSSEESNDNAVELHFYPIKAQAKEEFVAVETDNGYLVYRADTIPELTIDVFAPVSAGIYMGELYIDHFYYTEVAEEASAEDGTKYVLMIKDALMGTTAEEPEAWDDNSYTLRLYSATYQGLYYTVELKVAEDGTAYLYDVVYDRLYNAPEEIVARMLG